MSHVYTQQERTLAVEILTIDLSDESVQRIAAEVHRLITQAPSATQSNPPSPQYPQSAEPSGFQQQADPWLNQNPSPPQQQFGPPPAPTTSQGVTAYPQQPTQPQPAVQQAPPERFCPYGKMRFVPAGTNNQGRAYNAFYGCPLPRGDANQCRPV